MSNRLVHVTNRRATVREDQREVDFILSTDVEDRTGDTIDQNGWLLENYRKNPVVLWSHDHDEPAIGTCRNIRMEGASLVGTVKFATAEQNPFAETIFHLVAGGVINSGSVGFIAKRFEIRERGLAFLEQELIEFSICNVPMNPQALARAAKDGFTLPALANGTAKSEAKGYDAVRQVMFDEAAAVRDLEIAKQGVSLARFRNRAKALRTKLRLIE